MQQLVGGIQYSWAVIPVLKQKIITNQLTEKLNWLISNENNDWLQPQTTCFRILHIWSVWRILILNLIWCTSLSKCVFDIHLSVYWAPAQRCIAGHLMWLSAFSMLMSTPLSFSLCGFFSGKHSTVPEAERILAAVPVRHGAQWEYRAQHPQQLPGHACLHDQFPPEECRWSAVQSEDRVRKRDRGEDGETDGGCK